MEEENKIVPEESVIPSETQNEEQSEQPIEDTPQVEEPQTEPIQPTPQVEKPKKNILKFFKTIPGIITVAAVIACVVLAIVFINKHNKEKAYEENLQEFILESGKASMTSAYVCEDLRKIWSDYIFNDKKYFKKSDGSFTRYGYDADEYCVDFSEAVNMKIKWNKDNLPSSVTEPFFKAKRLYKDMTPAPSKYKDIHVYVKQMFKAMERLHELSENPTGNLSAFSSSCNSAVEEYTSALSDLTNECDIDFSKVDRKDKDDEFDD